jgi:protein-ribulosamine 3-kinase
MNQNEEQLFLSILKQHSDNHQIILSIRAISGGDINKAFKIDTSAGSFFAKLNSATKYPGMFAAEIKGLQLLKNTGTIFIPSIIGQAETEDISMLVLEFEVHQREKKLFWKDFGRNLAHLHKNTWHSFGLDHHNYIGSLSQNNNPSPEWIDFYIICRIEQQIRLARNNKNIDSSDVKLFERLYPHLSEFFPKEKPSLLHGDLWSGNFMTNHEGDACLIDPAVYYGHRLMDIAMSKLFGGFHQEFYEAYHNEYPLEKNWMQAIEIANLYPLMVHVNLFGGGYLSSVKSILKKF